ncbi:hypothetical protein F4780DRAFT_541647 [Xylariomycetidae sp. FL0641]|nr:hypothetical protein F4780DRAFT_541647 [Xylariomycetidae sp. FL0641]
MDRARSVHVWAGSGTIQSLPSSQNWMTIKVTSLIRLYASPVPTWRLGCLKSRTATCILTLPAHEVFCSFIKIKLLSVLLAYSPQSRRSTAVLRRLITKKWEPVGMIVAGQQHKAVSHLLSKQYPTFSASNRQASSIQLVLDRALGVPVLNIDRDRQRSEASNYSANNVISAGGKEKPSECKSETGPAFHAPTSCSGAIRGVHDGH